MFEAASQHKFDLILFWALDRLSREGVWETLQYLKTLESYDVGFRSFTEPYFDSCGDLQRRGDLDRGYSCQAATHSR